MDRRSFLKLASVLSVAPHVIAAAESHSAAARLVGRRELQPFDQIELPQRIVCESERMIMTLGFAIPFDAQHAVRVKGLANGIEVFKFYGHPGMCGRFWSSPVEPISCSDFRIVADHPGLAEVFSRTRDGQCRHELIEFEVERG